jgi:hypothetical protein
MLPSDLGGIAEAIAPRRPRGEATPSPRAQMSIHRITVYASAVLLAALVVPNVIPAQHQHPAAAQPDSRMRPDSAVAQDSAMGGHDMGEMMAGTLGISRTRMGSGTSWLPDSSPMHANHKMWGRWTAMIHGVAFLEYDKQYTRRGDDQLGIIDWEMVMAMRRVGSGMLHLRGMSSLEPVTIGAKGYPLLLQTGESYKGSPLFDRQHPHDLFMELAAMFEQPIASNLAVSLYGGAVGEPALGPVAFMHRPSAQSDPFAPLGHHWQDATHISYGVATVGLYSHRWKVEGSLFNGREPDENRWDFDFRRLDSYAGRLTVNPTGRWSFAGWYGYLDSPEELRPDESTRRYGASALYSGRGWRGGEWATLVMWGANAHGGETEPSAVMESNLELGPRNTVFARYEYVRKGAEDLVIPDAPPEQQYNINSVVAGYIREVGSIWGGTIGVGFRASLNFIPASLEPTYGTTTPGGFAVYLRVRPKRMVMGSEMSGMAAMQMGRDSMAGMQHAGAKDSAMMDSEHMRVMREIYMRMMADPVIRERAAKDTVIQRLMQRMPEGMMGDTTGVHAGHRADSAAADTPEARRAMEFVTLLLSDPQIEARVHADARLHRLWSDPDVQRCLEAMRRLKAAGQPLPAACPAALPAGGKHPH